MINLRKAIIILSVIMLMNPVLIYLSKDLSIIAHGVIYGLGLLSYYLCHVLVPLNIFLIFMYVREKVAARAFHAISLLFAIINLFIVIAYIVLYFKWIRLDYYIAV